MSSSPSLENFLIGAKHALKEAKSSHEKVTLVLGNERADLDSIAAAIVFAYLRTLSPPQNAWSRVYIPLLNIERSAVAERAMLARLLPHASITAQHLITLDDLVEHGSTKSGLQEASTRFFLVDQNIMLGREDQNYSRNVIGCIDHHRDENYVPQDTTPEPRIIGQAGSCTSLVVNYSRQSWDSINDRSSELSLAKLALAAILVDTRNLEDQSTVTDQDVSAAEFLGYKIESTEGGFDREAFYYNVIGEERPQATPRFVETSPVVLAQPVAVVETYTPAPTSYQYTYLSDILAQDFQKGSEGGAVQLGISHVTSLSLEQMVLQAERDLVNRAIEQATSGVTSTSTVTTEVMRGTPFTAAVREFALSKGLGLYAIQTETGVGRELFVWALDSKLAGLVPGFAVQRQGELGLERWGGEEDEIVKEAGMSDGMMRAFWVRGSVGREDVARALVQGTSGF